MKTSTLLAAAVLALPFTPRARAETTPQPTAAPEYKVYLSVEHYRWNEYQGGDELLEESGPLFGVGGEILVPLNRRTDFEGRARLFAGEVDYDGAVIGADGSQIPYESDTLYVGLEAEGDFGFPTRMPSGAVFRPYIGANVRYWSRSLDTSSDGKIGDYGYEEQWTSLSMTLGAEIKYQAVYGRAGLRLPVYNHENVDLGDRGGPEVDLEPGKELGFDAELGFEKNRFFAAIHYEYLEFSESDPDDDTGFYYQPDSKAHVIGLRAGIRL